jgi:Flp pilus assembly protein TadG
MARVKKFLKRWLSDEGAELIEYALVLPMLLLVVLGIAEFGFMFMRYEVITNAAREGARIAVLPGYSVTDVQNRVTAYVTQGRVPTTVTNPTVTVANVDIPVPGRLPISARRVTVAYTYNYMFLPGIGALFGQTYATAPLVAVAEMRMEVGN